MKKKNVMLGIIVATIIFEIFWLVLCVAANGGWKAMLGGSLASLILGLYLLATIWTYGVDMPESHQEVKENTKENKGEKK